MVLRWARTAGLTRATVPLAAEEADQDHPRGGRGARKRAGTAVPQLAQCGGGLGEQVSCAFNACAFNRARGAFVLRHIMPADHANG